MPSSSCPSLYQINTRVWLTELSGKPGWRATLDNIPDAELDRLAEHGFDWVSFLSVWQTGPAAQAISRANPEWHREFAGTLPDLNDEDYRRLRGSPLKLHRPCKIWAAKRRSRVCDTVAKTRTEADAQLCSEPRSPDHPWIDEHPE